MSASRCDAAAETCLSKCCAILKKKGRKIRLNLERGAVSREVRKETQFTNSAKAQTFFFFKEKGHLLISTSCTILEYVLIFFKTKKF